MQVIFWLVLFVILYHLIGYILILKLFSTRSSTNEIKVTNYPSITVLCPAYNEEEKIEEKIISFRNLDYPKDKIKMIVISDDSTDNTNEIVKKYENENVKLVIQKPRKGKVAGHNMVLPSINTDYVLSTDANSIFHKSAVLELVKTMESDDRIGIVSGELRLKKKNDQDSGEGIYWKFESLLKKMESDWHSIIGANGSIFLIKREFFTKLLPGSVDDFERTLLVLKNNYIGKYNRKAKVFEETSEKSVEELQRKVRIISRQLFAIKRNSSLLNFFRFPRISWMLFSHKIIRWSLPLWSLLLFLSSIILGLNSTFFAVISLLQILFYLGGSIELKLESAGSSWKPLKIPAYFLTMNVSAFLAFLKFLKGEQMATWDTIREEK